MLQRKPVFPNVIEMNHQAGQRLGCNVYLVFDGPEWILIDVGYDETVDEIVELIRQLDFPLSNCQALVATHTDSQLSFRLGELLFSGDNIYRDGCVGAIDAHHGSDLVDFLKSLGRIRSSDVRWLLPSHGPIFKKDNKLIDRAIARLEGYLHM